jgi:hypothetical protein
VALGYQLLQQALAWMEIEAGTEKEFPHLLNFIISNGLGDLGNVRKIYEQHCNLNVDFAGKSPLKLSILIEELFYLLIIQKPNLTIYP